jgi:hypothetical protein
MRDLQDLPPKEVGKLLALAGIALRKREASRFTMVEVDADLLDGPITEQWLRNAARGLIAQRRIELGIEHFDLAELRTCDD